ncbi:MAG: DnaJ like chaperone protein [Gammaproteobacteria bacterium]|jgi:DnaJ like chaperone protein|nr:DnaJ like chaperone protein [Gammaproteobacteria bacterium]
MSWKGAFLGGVIGLMTTHSVWGAVVGALIGQLIEQSGALGAGGAGGAGRTTDTISISEEFFRTTFEFMGHVAKSDGRVSEAEIDAARRLMNEMKLGAPEISIAIACFRAGKSASYDAELGVERLREACGQRHELLRAFMELQLRAALAGNGISPPARAILTRVAERLGMSGLEFAYMEAALRARQRTNGASAGRPATGAGSLAECYAELEVDPEITNQEVTKAYRRQMSRHHPDKLVANGLPESMAQMAKEKTQRIQEAYEGIRAARGMR